MKETVMKHATMVSPLFIGGGWLIAQANSDRSPNDKKELIMFGDASAGPAVITSLCNLIRATVMYCTQPTTSSWDIISDRK
jgi:hypothetical protein